MRLNRLETVLMNNPVRATAQRRFEARRLLRLGGPAPAGRVLEIGCGRGVGVELILEMFGAETVDAFDLDPDMIRLARRRLGKYGSRVRLWVGDAVAVGVPDSTYDAVFDFGAIHHVHDWRRALREVHRILKPGGRLYAEEILERLIAHPLMRRIFVHPEDDRFDGGAFLEAMRPAGLEPVACEEMWGLIAWVVARKGDENRSARKDDS